MSTKHFETSITGFGPQLMERTWGSSLLWIPAAALLGFAIAAIFAGSCMDLLPSSSCRHIIRKRVSTQPYEKSWARTVYAGAYAPAFYDPDLQASIDTLPRRLGVVIRTSLHAAHTQVTMSHQAGEISDHIRCP